MTHGFGRARWAAIGAVAVSLGGVAAGCGGSSGATSPTPATSEATSSVSAPDNSNIPTVSVAAPAGSSSPVSSLVGQWNLLRSCASTVAALTKAGLATFIPTELEHEELVTGMVDGKLPTDFDPTDPCEKATPPFEHSHTFWPDAGASSAPTLCAAAASSSRCRCPGE